MKQEYYKELNEAMGRFNPPPADFDSFVEKEVVPTYIFYSRKEKWARCSHCHEKFLPFQELKHKAKVVCPKCGKQATGHSAGYKKTKPDIIWSCIVTPNNGDVLVQYFRSVIDWHGLYHTTDTSEELRYVHGADGCKVYMYWHDRYGRYDWMPYRRRGYYWGAYESDFYLPGYTVPYGDIEKSLVGTHYQYCPINLLLQANGTRDGYMFGMYMDDWLNYYREHPQVEQVVKVGFFNLVRAATSYIGLKLHEGRNVMDILGVTKAQFRLLRALGDPTYKDFEVVKSCEGASLSDIQFMSSIANRHDFSWKRIWDMRTSIPMGKLSKLFSSQGIKATDYCDYIGWLVALGYNIGDRYYTLPNDFQTAHDKMCAEYKAYLDKKKKAEKRLQNKLIAKLKAGNTIEAFSMHHGGLFVKMAGSADELKKEGETLHHCVATYADRVAKGETIILFIRKESDPDTPYFTMEFKGGQIVQVRGYANCSASPDVAQFRTAFERAIEKELLNRKAVA